MSSKNSPSNNLITRQANTRLNAVKHAEETYQQTLEKRDRNLFQRLFPNELDKELHQHQVTEMRQIGEARRRGLSMALEAKLQAVEEELNETLLKGKAELRVERELFVQAQFDRLLYELNRRMEEYQSELERRFTRLDSLQHPQMRSLEEQRIERDYRRYEDWIDSKIGEFKVALADGVKR